MNVVLRQAVMVHSIRVDASRLRLHGYRRLVVSRFVNVRVWVSAVRVDVFSNVLGNKTVYGIVPIENSKTGLVHLHMDLLTTSQGLQVSGCTRPSTHLRTLDSCSES